ncbi:hypothetical protein Ais01nite_74950 [Asanoa ishikariensis]|uniref:META domain-containing protein n=1 Tax=Asanoa ishikariensis TaxID=137265 RepID=UPI0015A1763F|nr:META domain-containing protein [Asanoa ishikariensis]GIF69460.1 hypothetical protein Ais01nite_74950 [Asanoa ishikariensis]
MGSVLFIPLLILAACAHSEPGRRPGELVDIDASGRPLVDGRTFIATLLTQDGAAKQVVAGTRIQFEFTEAGRVRASAGCNMIDGEVHLDVGQLNVDEVSITNLGCEQRRHEQDEWISSFLQSGPAWKVNGDELILSAAGAEIRLKDRNALDPDWPLLSTKWMVVTFLADGNASSVPGGVEAYLIFGTNSTVTGKSGCNAITGKSAVAEGKIAVADVVTTDMACAAPARDIERFVLRVLEQTMTYKIEANRLTLATPDGSGMQLVASA